MSYATLDEVKSAVGIDDSRDDSELQIALDATVDLVDRHCRRTFVENDQSGSAETRIFEGGTCVGVDDLVAVDKIETRSSHKASWTEVPSDDYELRPLNADTRSFPYTQVLLLEATHVWQVRVTAHFGWPATPDAVKQATILQASRIARRREAPFGISQVPSFDGNTGMRLLSKLDADVELLLQGFRRNPVLIA